MVHEGEAVEGSDDAAIGGGDNTLWRVPFPDQGHEQRAVLLVFSLADACSAALIARVLLLLLLLL